MPKNQTTLAIDALADKLAERFDRMENMFLAVASGAAPFDPEAEAAAVEAAAAAEAAEAEAAKAAAKAARAEAKAKASEGAE